jgi:diguanylate cyclase
MTIPAGASASSGAAPAIDAVPGSASRDLRFVRRIHRMRTLGLGLGCLCVGSVFRLHGASPLAWIALFVHGYVWPHVALLLASRSAHPVSAERRNLAVDSALGGVWVALMQFNLLPSALLVTMLCADKVAVGGARLALRTTIALVLACGVTTAVLQIPVALDTPMPVIVACLPFLAAYPLAISAVMHALGTRVAQQNRRLMELSQTDDLTGLPNRREGLAAAARELARHRRNGSPAVLMVIDIDHFKQINDRHGHPAGDEILRGVAELLRHGSRASDTPARYAGDEFLLLMPATDLDGAVERAERLRQQLAASSFPRAPGVRCKVSLGAAAARDEMVDVEDWLQQADAALYRAKAAGRDRAVMAEAPAPAAERAVAV